MRCDCQRYGSGSSGSGLPFELGRGSDCGQGLGAVGVRRCRLWTDDFRAVAACGAALAIGAANGKRTCPAIWTSAAGWRHPWTSAGTRGKGPSGMAKERLRAWFFARQSLPDPLEMGKVQFGLAGPGTDRPQPASLPGEKDHAEPMLRVAAFPVQSGASRRRPHRPGSPQQAIASS